MTLKIQPPDRSEVTFTYTIEPDDTPIRGNAMASGDDDADREAEDWIFAQLRKGNLAAWCGLVVRAEWRGHVGLNSIWGCSYESEEALLAEWLPELNDEAFEDLCRGLREGLAKIEDRIEVTP